jgi:hypothetical protein
MDSRNAANHLQTSTRIINCHPLPNSYTICEHAQVPCAIQISTLNGDNFRVDLAHANFTFKEVKVAISRKTGFVVEELWTTLDGNAESRIVRDDEWIRECRKLAMVARVATTWDEEWKGSKIMISTDGSTATSTARLKPSTVVDEEQMVRTDCPLIPNSGIHCFEFTYTTIASMNSEDMVGGSFVGLVVGETLSTMDAGPLSVGKPNDQGGIGRAETALQFWAMNDVGELYFRDMHNGEEPKWEQLEVNSEGWGFCPPDRVTLAVDTDNCAMCFFRNGEKIEAAFADGLPLAGADGEPQLYIFASLVGGGHTTVATSEVEPTPEMLDSMLWDHISESAEEHKERQRARGRGVVVDLCEHPARAS